MSILYKNIKKVVVFLFLLFVPWMLLADGSYNASFAHCSDFDIEYYLPEDEGTINIGIINPLPEGQRVNISYPENAERVITSVRCTFYKNDARAEDADPISLNIYQDENGVYYFNLPTNTHYHEIAIEPLVEFRKYTVDLKDYCDDDSAVGGVWSVNGRSYNQKETLGNSEGVLWNSDHQFIASANDQYSVKYAYDNTKYYLISTKPESIASELTGEVVFKIVEQGKAVIQDYEVRLKQYFIISIDKDDLKKVISIQNSLGEILDKDNLSQYRFKAGDSIVVTTRLDAVPDARGLIANGSMIVEKERITSFTIPKNSDSYDASLFINDKKTKEITISWNVDEGFSASADISFFVGKRKYDFYDNYKNTKPLTVSLAEDEVLYVNIKKPADNVMIELTVDGTKYPDIQEDVSMEFPFGSVESVEVSVFSGYRLNYDNLNNSKNIDVVYLADGSYIKDKQFLKEGTEVQIYIRDCPHHLEPKNVNLDEKSLEGHFSITGATTMNDFRVIEEAVPGIWIDPKDYSFDQGVFEFYIGGSKITEESFVRLEDKLEYVAKPNEGYRHSQKDGSRVLIEKANNEYELEKALDLLKFYRKDSRTVELWQPDYGGTIKYYADNGVLLEEPTYTGLIGEKITGIITPEGGFTVDGNQDKITYEIKDSESQSTRYSFDGLIREMDENKLSLSFILSGKSWTDDFTVSYLANNAKESTKVYEKSSPVSEKVTISKDKITVKEKISLTAPFEITVGGYIVGNGQLFKATITLNPKKEKGVNSSSVEFVFLSQKTVFRLPDEIRNMLLDSEVRYESVDVKVELVNGYLFKGISIPFAQVSVSRNGIVLVEGKDCIQDDETLSVVIDPNDNCIIVGSNSFSIKGAELKNLNYVPVKFVSDDEYGSYEYSVKTNNNNIIVKIAADRVNTDAWFLIRDTDTLKVVFTVNNRYKIDWSEIYIIPWFHQALDAKSHTVTISGEDLKKLSRKTISTEVLSINLKGEENEREI